MVYLLHDPYSLFKVHPSYSQKAALCFLTSMLNCKTRKLKLVAVRETAAGNSTVLRQHTLPLRLNECKVTLLVFYSPGIFCKVK